MEIILVTIVCWIMCGLAGLILIFLELPVHTMRFLRDRWYMIPKAILAGPLLFALALFEFRK